MPELPEVETIRRGLEDKLIGREITDISVRAPKIFQGQPESVVGLEILGLDRYGKLLVVRLSNGKILTIHLKMTGQLIWKRDPDQSLSEAEIDDIDNATLPLEIEDGEEEVSKEDVVVGGHPEKSYLQPLPHKHTHVIFSFNDGSRLYFNDLRKFGYIKVLTIDELPNLSFLQKLGPEPLEVSFTLRYLETQLKKRPRQPIKSFLLDQSNIAGLGNIYADESLFKAAILPDRPTGSLTPGETHNLHNSIQEVLELALLHGGSSSRDYLNALGERGTFLAVANVYHRTGQDCNRCATGHIQRQKIGGRSSHYCPICQR